MDTWVPNPLRYGESMQVEIVANVFYADFFWTTNDTVCSDETVLPGYNLTRPLVEVPLDAGPVLDDTVFLAGVNFASGFLYEYIALLNRFLPPATPDTTIAEFVVNSAIGYSCAISTRSSGSAFTRVGNETIRTGEGYIFQFDDCADTQRQPKSYRANCTNLFGTHSKAFTIDITEKLGCEGSYNPFIILGSGMPFDRDRYPPQIIHAAPNCSATEVCLVRQP
uniref:Uncharacterized protein n=1 Tax=Lotharella oceanica TaxID=641309 RepID=A0A7S2TTA0_9EUKA|mmetsp:Transcript_28563/g.53540  ORF Transcript_28563/g.53540 Transcript_28563/m.53540 type:complete len:223 (+) Transcript_28563:387-1055(+)